MIQVARSAEPAALRRNKTRWRTGLGNAKTPKAREQAQNKYRHKGIKAALIALFHGKCAYCESKITHVDYGHIEHFRPKGRFPKSCFTWTNMFLACGVCNGRANKGTRFPSATQGGPLIDPCREGPATHLRFDFDPVLRVASVRSRTTRGRTTRDVLDLNRSALRTHRSKHVARLYVLACCAQAGDPQAMTLWTLVVAAAQAGSEEYAAFVRELPSLAQGHTQQDEGTSA